MRRRDRRWTAMRKPEDEAAWGTRSATEQPGQQRVVVGWVVGWGGVGVQTTNATQPDVTADSRKPAL